MCMCVCVRGGGVVGGAPAHALVWVCMWVGVRKRAGVGVILSRRILSPV